MMIIPERLHKLRIRRGLSQPLLAKKSRISVRQLQRIEKSSEPGKSVRETTLSKLAENLDVKTEVLTGEAPLPDDSNKVSQRETERVQIGALIQAESRLAYDLVKIRYGIKATEIINIAPLFFVLLAEGSLAWRREKLRELNEAIERMKEIGRIGDNSIGHLSYSDCALVADNALSFEKKSIDKADLFGEHLPGEAYDFGYDPSTGNPFADYLRWFADELDNPGIVKITSGELKLGLEGFPDYEICGERLDKISGDSQKARQALKNGTVRLADIPEELVAEDVRTERVKWLEDREDEERVRLEDWFDRFLKREAANDQS
ncbi:MAG: helix-turn-helix transcriptional regulator [Gammaproteobacteria bacterium]|nr:helix-turn-helix transcriptional regulator [Gammaproteobacteria bacterium]